MSLENKFPAITEGLKSIAIGKKGSKPLGSQLIKDIRSEFNLPDIPPVLVGAFWGALFLKGLTKDEKELEMCFEPGVLKDASKLIEYLSPQTNAPIKAICTDLLNKQTLNLKTTQILGKFLFSTEESDALRGLAANVLRMRYETPDEFEGLLQSIERTANKEWVQKETCKDDGPLVVQFAEPFNGVTRTNMITPLVAHHFQKLDFKSVTLVGRNSGPKFGNNLADMANSLNGHFLRSPKDVFPKNSPYGSFIHQKDYSTALDRWVDLRRLIVKRPFLATLERFVNPCNAFIHISSAFHPPYGEKMLTICNRAQFPGAIIVRGGMEGGIAFPLLRPVKLLCIARQLDGRYLQKEFTFNANEFIDQAFQQEEKLENPLLKTNVQLIEGFLKNKKTNNPLFDSRVKFTCEGLAKAVEWVFSNSVIPSLTRNTKNYVD